MNLALMVVKGYKRVGHDLLRASRRVGTVVWPKSARLLPPPTAKFRRYLIALLIIAAASALGAALMRITGNDVSTEAWSVPATALRIQARISSIANSLDSARDWLSDDPVLIEALASHGQIGLFSLLNQRSHDFAVRLPDSTRFVDLSSDRAEANRGVAIYAANGTLLAWNTPLTATFGFDTVLTESMRLPKHDRGVLIENGPIYANLISIRKLVSQNGLTEAYVVVKQQLATKQPLTISPATSFIDDLQVAAERPIILSYGGATGIAKSDKKWYREDLFAAPSDPASFVGTLAIGRVAERIPSLGFQILNTLWMLALALAILSFLVWLLTTITNAISISQPRPARITYSTLALVALVLARLTLILIGSDTHWFATSSQKSVELFITSLFVAATAVIIWIIWIPQEHLLWDEPIARNDTTVQNVKSRHSSLFTLLPATVFSVIAIQLLIGGLSVVTEYIIHNSAIHYLTIDHVLPAPNALLMLLAFLDIGVAFLFLAVLLIMIGLRGATRVTSRFLGVRRRLAVGALLLFLLLIAVVLLFNLWQFSDTSLSYRAGLTLLTFLIALPILLMDEWAPRPRDSQQSFLYLLPRSSRSILFILAASAIVMSPLIATKQLSSDKIIARHVAVENEGSDTLEFHHSAQQLLSAAVSRLASWRQDGSDTSALHEEGFLIWRDGMKDHPLWNTTVDVFNATGMRESHFATLGAAGEWDSIRPQIDSQLSRIRRGDSIPIGPHFIESFTSAGSPAIVGSLAISDSTLLTQRGRPPSTLTPQSLKVPFFVVVSLWNGLPALTTAQNNISLLPSTTKEESRAASERGFVIAQYRPDMRRLTNSPALDVPATVPAIAQTALHYHDSIWMRTQIGENHYQTLYYRSGTASSTGVPTIVSVSIPEPSFGHTLEFALRLNAIGLLYGTLLVILLLIARQFSARRIRFTPRFRDRIFFVVLLIALVPLVVVTNVTRSLLAERAQVEEQDRLSRDAVVIKERIARAMEQPSPVQSDGGLETQVDYLSQIIGRDFSIYDPLGRLEASSRPELYESSLLASTLNSTAAREILFGNRSFFTEPVQIGRNAYTVGYQAVTSVDGTRLLAVLALATMNEQPRIEAEIARTTSFIYGTFAALGLVLLGIGALFAARVASPILELIRATENVAKGKLETSIPTKREDEIGDLMRAFNTMTRELERSREIVAQTERELAWKEMARQVAHEIKNPLTPMKLSVQHLEHAHEAKDPNFNTIFRRVIRTMREQIDVLTRIATEFAHFGAMPRRRWGAVDIRKVADSAVALFDAERSRIRFIVDVPKDLPRVHSDEEELRRAFVNLLRNAVQAMEGWGIIIIRARSGQGMINIRLRDTGFGMSEETLKRVFDPNFSTKTSGMGLGLAIVKKTVTDMAGTIRVESVPGHGTTFLIDLPARADLGEES